jgi:hypothetical protein
MRMHEKPFKCDVPGCRRKPGFTTVNDLNRHKIAKHFDGVDPSGKAPSYMCRGKDCKNSTKIWPRMDNFKAHVLKMHVNEDPHDLIERYVSNSVRCLVDHQSSRVFPTPRAVGLDDGPGDAPDPLDEMYRLGKNPTFMCQGKNCKNNHKIWYRLDNFKSHVLKMHEAEDCQLLIKRQAVKFREMLS